MPYMCEYGNCTIEKESKDMIVLTIPYDFQIRRFCSKEHLKLWINEKYKGD